MAILGLTSVNPAFPMIARDLSITPEKTGLLLALFTLPGILLTPVFGLLADKFGRKKVLIFSLFLMGVAGLFCGFTKDFNILLSFRVLQGVGSSSLGALNIALIGDIYKEELMPKVLGYNNAVLNIGTGVFPIIGGALAQFNWQYVFYLNGFAIVLALILLFNFKEPERKKSQKENYLAALVTNLKQKNILFIFGLSIFVYIILFGSYLTYLPFIADINFSVEPVYIGLLFSGMSFTNAFVSIFFGKILKKYPAKSLFIYSFSLYAVALFMIPIVPSWQLLFIPTILFGLAHGVNLPNIQTRLIRNSNPAQRGILISLNRTFSQTGQTLGPVIGGAILAAPLLGGLPSVFYFSAGLSGIIFIIFLLNKSY
jgi:MFS family permease